MWMLPSAYAGSDEYPWGLPALWLHFTRLLGLSTSLMGRLSGPLHHAVSSCLHSRHGGTCLSSPVPSRYCSEELKGCSKGLRFLSLFLAICRERRLATVTFLTFSEYCLTVLSRKNTYSSFSQGFFGSFYFYAGNPKQWEEHTIMWFVVISFEMNDF